MPRAHHACLILIVLGTAAVAAAQSPPPAVPSAPVSVYSQHLQGDWPSLLESLPPPPRDPSHWKRPSSEAAPYRTAQLPSGPPSPLEPLPVPEETVPPPVALPEDADDEIPVVALEPPWYDPRYWWGPGWCGSLELGINGSEGNSETLSFRVGGNFKRKTKKNIMAFDFTHNKATNEEETTQNNVLTNFRYDHLMGDSPWTLFLINTGEYDEFKAFDWRVVVNVGVGYQIIRTDRTLLAARLGSGVSHEIGGPDDAYVPEALFGLDFSQDITKKMSIYAKADYFPAWDDFSDYRVTMDAGWETVLEDFTNLSLKLGVTDRYDSTPNGREPNDFTYSFLLLWRM